MLIWINGAFGAGKTTTAFELQKRLPNSRVYDPENAGYFIRKNLPKALWKVDFQDHPLWRQINLEMLRLLAKSEEHVIIPMTLVHRPYYNEIVQPLLEEGIHLHMILLLTEKVTLQHRLRKRFEGTDNWALRQADRCLQALQHDIPGFPLSTDHLTIEQVTEEIARHCGLTLLPDRRSPLRKNLDHIWISLQHIR